MAFTSKNTHFEFTDGLLDCHARTIKESARALCAAVQTARSALDSAGQTDKPLFVFMGEYHAQPAHYMHFMHVLEELHRTKNNIILANEMDHDYAAQLYFKRREMEYDTDIAQNILDLDNIDELNTLSYDAIFTHQYANISTKISDIYCAKLGLKNVFSDCATNRERQEDQDFAYQINNEDHATAAAFLSAGLDSEQAVDPESENGLFLRNVFMLDQLCVQSVGEKSPIIILRCGAGHVFGEQGSSPFEQSLTGLAQDKGLDIVSFVPDLAFDCSAGETVLDKVKPDTAIFSRLPHIKAYNEGDDHDVYNEKIDKDEELYCAEILSRLDMSEHFSSAADISAHQRKAYKHMKLAYKQFKNALSL
tara:strand:- start:501444 stop:502535 length:1092 start_codon:yes stop_codon:yes gene_type:complete